MITQGMYIGNRYEIVERVGAGGMSDVYRAVDHTLGRHVAIKVLKDEFSQDVNFVTKFRTEASSAAGLEHPNIVNIYDVGSQSDFHYIVMELIEGITLKTYIEKKGQLTFKEAASIAIQVGRGIEAAHNKGIIHRDIKPQNIIISTEGKVKVTDFGIAKAASSNTISSDVMGSVHYSSPEQARNGFVDGKSDIYSLGIVMYEMVTGRVPFDGDTTVAVAIQHLQEEMETPKTYAPELPVSMEKIILKCTQKSPDRRYDNITALLSDLRKSLISPDEDFVVIAPVSQDKTRIISPDEVDKIKNRTGNMYVDEAALVGGTMKRDDEDNEGYENTEGYDDDEEDEIDPRMDKAITIAGIAAGVVIVILIIVILVNFLGGLGKDKDKQPNTQQQSQTTETQVDSETETETEKGVEVVDIRGLTIAEAKEVLNADGLGVRKAGTEASDDYEEGEIISQTPEAGDFVKPNTTIEVIVSSGPARINIPNVKGLTEKEAKDKLEDAGFEVTVKEDFSATVEKGKVISQSPGANSLGNEGDTVTIVVSKGKEQVKVPNLLNKTKEEAVKALTDLGLEAGTVTEENSDTVEKDKVMKQSVEADKEVDKGTKVDLVISLGKKTVKVTNVVGATKETAITALEALGLKVTVKEEESSKTAGTVIAQSIEANKEVAQGSAITITVAKPLGKTTVPDIKGASEASALELLKARGLAGSKSGEEYSATVPAGSIISQGTAANTEVTKGTTISYVVSKGPEPISKVNVPNLVGKSDTDAAAALAAVELTGEVTKEHSDSVEAGKVISQGTPADTQVDKGTKITYVVSLGKAQVEVPVLEGKTRAEAEAALAAVNLFGSATEENSDSVPAESIIRQGTPAGTLVDKGTTISYVVSTGANTQGN